MAMLVAATAATSTVGCMTGCLCEVVVSYMGRPVAKEAERRSQEEFESLEDLPVPVGQASSGPELLAHAAGCSMDRTVIHTSQCFTPDLNTLNVMSSNVEDHTSLYFTRDLSTFSVKPSKVETEEAREDAQTRNWARALAREVETEEAREDTQTQGITEPDREPDRKTHTTGFSLEHTIVRFTPDPDTPKSDKVASEEVKGRTQAPSNASLTPQEISALHSRDQWSHTTGFSIDHTFVQFTSNPDTPKSQISDDKIERKELVSNQWHVLEERSPSLTQLATPSSKTKLPAQTQLLVPAPSSPRVNPSPRFSNKQWASAKEALETDLLRGLTDGSLGVSLCSGMLKTISKEDLHAGKTIDGVQSRLCLTLSSRSLTTALTSKAIFNKLQFFGISDEKWLSIERKLRAELLKGVEAGSLGVSLCANVPREDLKLEASSAAKAKPTSQFLVSLNPGSLADALNVQQGGADEQTNCYASHSHEETLQEDLSKGLDNFSGFLNWSLQTVMPQEELQVPELVEADTESMARAKMQMQRQLLSSLNSGWLAAAMNAKSPGASDGECLRVKQQLQTDFSEWMEDGSLGVSLCTSISKEDLKSLAAQLSMQNPTANDEWLRVKTNLQTGLFKALKEGSWCISLQKAIQKEDNSPSPSSTPQSSPSPLSTPHRDDNPEATPVSRINFDCVSSKKVEPVPIPIHTPERSLSPERPRSMVQDPGEGEEDEIEEHEEEGEEEGSEANEEDASQRTEQEEEEEEGANEESSLSSQLQSPVASSRSTPSVDAASVASLQPHSSAASVQSGSECPVSSLQSPPHSPVAKSEDWQQALSWAQRGLTGLLGSSWWTAESIFQSKEE
jgi:hypothetical protein